MADTLSMSRGMILLLDKITNELVVEASIGIDSEKYPVKDTRYQSDEGVVGKVFRLGVPILIPDISKEPMFLNKLGRDDSDEEFSFIAVPIKHEGVTYGVLAVDKVVSKMYSVTTDVDILKMISTMMASYLYNIHYFESQIQAVEQEKAHIENEKLKLMGEVSKNISSKDLWAQAGS